eukprot:55249-Eustigmatos_ZCMA.PRE.1
MEASRTEVSMMVSSPSLSNTHDGKVASYAHAVLQAEPSVGAFEMRILHTTLHNRDLVLQSLNSVHHKANSQDD